MAKKVTFGPKPTGTDNLEAWISSPAESVPPPPEPETKGKMKRLTLDIPEDLHRAIKRRAVDAGVAMVDMLRDLLEQNYGKQ